MGAALVEGNDLFVGDDECVYMHTVAGPERVDVIYRRLDDDGRVADVYFQVVELRGFERFCVGRPAEELARITPKICGVCPTAHHMAAAKALDDLYKVEGAIGGGTDVFEDVAANRLVTLVEGK